MSIFDVKWLYQLNVFKPPVRYVRVNIEQHNKREINSFKISFILLLAMDLF